MVSDEKWFRRASARIRYIAFFTSMTFPVPSRFGWSPVVTIATVATTGGQQQHRRWNQKLVETANTTVHNLRAVRGTNESKKVRVRCRACGGSRWLGGKSSVQGRKVERAGPESVFEVSTPTLGRKYDIKTLQAVTCCIDVSDPTTVPQLLVLTILIVRIQV